MEVFHEPVLLKEAIGFLNVKKGGLYIDATLGGGGHTEAISKLGGKVLGIDRDPDALAWVEENQRSKIPAKGWSASGGKDQRLILVRGNFVNLKEIADANGFGQADGIIYDLGASLHQLTLEKRGFSFRSEEPLDMRMDPNLSVTAADLINGLNEGELAELFEKYGEEEYAKRVARKIVKERLYQRIDTCIQLAELVCEAVPRLRGQRIHPATRVFQALRIAVNDEINNLKISLPQAAPLLNVGGRLVVIAFHSLEARVVRDFFSREVRLMEMTDRPLRASSEEVSKNQRARSALLFAFEKMKL